MGWWSWAEGAISTTINVARYGYKTVKNLFSQIGVTPEVVYSTLFNKKIRALTGHVLRITVEDVVPIVILSYVKESIQRQGRAYLDDHRDDALVSTDTLIQTGLFLTGWTLWAIQKRFQAEALARTAVVILETTGALKHKIQPMTICEDEKCTTLRFLKGSFRDIISYYGTELLIEGVSYIPWIGGSVAMVFSIIHKGRYATKVVLPLCDRHEEQYLIEHSEFALAQGLSHEFLTQLTSRSIEWLTGLPRPYYESSVRQFLVPAQIVIAAHMTLPSPVKETKRTFYEPVGYFVTGIGLGFDIVVAGCKIVIPQRLKNRLPSTIPWEKVPGIALQAWSHPLTVRIKPWLLPGMLQNPTKFINDPLIRYHWDGLRDKSVNALINIKTISDMYVVKIATVVPGATIQTVYLVFGMPQAVTNMLLKIIGNEAVLTKLNNIRRELEDTHTGKPPGVTPNPTSHPIRGREGVEEPPGGNEQSNQNEGSGDSQRAVLRYQNDSSEQMKAEKKSTAPRRNALAENKNDKSATAKRRSGFFGETAASALKVLSSPLESNRGEKLPLKEKESNGLRFVGGRKKQAVNDEVLETMVPINN